MAKYDVTRACGHKETIALFGKGKDREWRLENIEASKLCYDCYQAELAKRNHEATEAAKEMNLPQLTGTEKQIPWAESIRQQLLADLDKFVYENVKEEHRNDPMVRAAMEHIRNKTEARWWIDNRGAGAYEFRQLLDEAIKATKTEQAQAPAEMVSQAKAEATVRPESPKTETVAEIRPLENAVEIDFPEKRDDFRELVKFKLGMCWNGTCWRREIKAVNGTPADRTTEAGHKLLAAGFPIRIYDAEIRQRAIDGNYELEQTRWIYRRKDDAKEYPGWFAIKWGRQEDFYDAAKKIKGSRYKKPFVVVPPEQFEQVLDFAQMYGFSLSENAQALADEARQAKEAALVVKVNPVQNESVTPDGKPPVLDVPEKVEVDDEFKD